MKSLVELVLERQRQEGKYQEWLERQSRNTIEPGMACRPKNMDGQRFGRLVVVLSHVESKRGHVLSLCQCDCGALVKVWATSMRAGNTRSCGCLAGRGRGTR